MNKKEISEIKKQLNLRDCNLQGLAGCYVNGSKDIIKTWNRKFLTLEESDIFKYMEIFKRALSGKLGRTLYNINPSDHACRMMQAVVEDFQSEEKLMNFYERIINHFEYVGNFLILSAYGVYDVPGRTKDGLEIEDGSEDIYRYTIHCVCPVNLSAPGLAYDQNKEEFSAVDRDWMLDKPEIAVVYPAFNDRQEDPTAALLFAKQLDEDIQEFTWNTLGAVTGRSPAEEKEIWKTLVEEILGPGTNIAEISKVEAAAELRAEYKKEQKDDTLDISDFLTIFIDAGIEGTRLDKIDDILNDVAGTTKVKINRDNIVNLGKMAIETEHGKIQVERSSERRVYESVIDGKSCLVMELDQDEKYTVNGYAIRTGGKEDV